MAKGVIVTKLTLTYFRFSDLQTVSPQTFQLHKLHQAAQSRNSQVNLFQISVIDKSAQSTQCQRKVSKSFNKLSSSNLQVNSTAQSKPDQVPKHAERDVH